MEPNLALNLEVSDLINSKKGNACVCITPLISKYRTDDSEQASRSRLSHRPTHQCQESKHLPSCVSGRSSPPDYEKAVLTTQSYSIFALKIADTPFISRSAPKNFSTSLFADFRRDRQSVLQECSLKSWRLSKNGGRRYVRHRDTRRILASSGTCTGYFCTKATCFPRCGEKTLRC
jgi:hypothetical protein